jgi:MoxR-like ATPase
MADHVKRYAVRLVRATHPDGEIAPPAAKKYVKFGASPRGIQAMILTGKVLALVDGRAHLSCADVRAVALPSLRHRLILNFEGEAEGITTDSVIGEVLAAVPEIRE